MIRILSFKRYLLLLLAVFCTGATTFAQSVTINTNYTPAANTGSFTEPCQWAKYIFNIHCHKQ